MKIDSFTDSPEKLFRIFDANLNRSVEGLRVLEDFARLFFDEKTLSSMLKELRHKIVLSVDEKTMKTSLKNRNSCSDIGKDTTTKYQEEPKSILGIINSNARRSEEALRVLEEVSASSLVETSAEVFRKARFELYEIQKQMAELAERKEKIAKTKGLHVIIDEGVLGSANALDMSEAVLRGGADVLQMRYKKASRSNILNLAKELKALCEKYKALFIVNDYVDIAAAAEADGVHLGQDDLPAKEARKLLKYGAVIGVSCNTVNELKNASGADYIGTGAVYPTGSKNDIKTIGLDGLRTVADAANLPIVAIGGINKDNISNVFSAGASGAAVISSVLLAKDSEHYVKQLKDTLVKING